MEWLSLHIFYDGDLDQLLADGLRPLLARISECHAGLRFFFLRYWNGGPHIRLRLSVDGAEADSLSAIEEEVRRELKEWLSARPGGRRPEEYESQRARMTDLEARLSELIGPQDYLPEEPEPLQPAGSVQRRPYRFDEVRHGGAAARAIAESHFCSSAELALLIVSRTLGRKAARLTLGLYLSAAAATVMCCPAEEGAALYAQASRGLLIMYPERGDDLQAALGFPSYEEERDNLGDLVSQLSGQSPLPGQTPLANQLIQRWEDELRSRWAQLRAAHAAGAIEVEPRYLLMDYLHLMNNRLGVEVPQECYLYYLVGRALAEMGSGVAGGSSV